MKNLLGPSIQIDPAFPYYQHRSEQSIVDELECTGVRVVHLFVTDETRVNQKLLDQLHSRGFKVWATVFGNGTYITDHLPKDWPDWQMTLLKPVNDGYYRLSPFSYRYVAWKKKALANLVTSYPFDGLEVAEPYFPEWNGLSTGVYGDVGPYARAAFKQQYGSDIPDFKHKSSKQYYKNNPILYRQWMEFRVSAVNRFLFELINGQDGVRAARPGLPIATWSLAVDAGADSVEKLREFQGLDAAAMISVVRPEMHFIQTHWPDWMRWRLPADYAKRYTPFVAKIRAMHPSIPLGLQTDIGSLRPMRRSRGWLQDFASAAEALGYSTWTAYEYHLGKYMYTEPPVAVQAKRKGSQRVVVCFQKRVDPETAGLASNYRIMRDSEPQVQCTIHVVKVDGNTVLLESECFPSGRFDLWIGKITDTPKLWLFPERQANEAAQPCLITVE
ncbi:N-acyl-D-glucosamine 2-epimerase [Paenibacillus xerothermodurans]|uniref:N-acyl-D-glucosamine 2-epimerase n=1 Tax=Paenibacillus xerothermodurans TaxID=1977292 RepID=A0A2W1NFC9_PAEXE|nr:N-acyl-D-glucosamine 2-epimerase [Paenibacillus xerothermodurans]PZE21771.1 N-acyl-D-glucosamine 2-epimerase [Paenibacillus xerothermodurans]